jgi:hypothetical protein
MESRLNGRELDKLIAIREKISDTNLKLLSMIIEEKTKKG